MMGRAVSDPAPWLSILGGTLTTSYVGGAWVALTGCDELEARCSAIFDAASALSSISFRLVTSDDGVNVDPLVTYDASSSSAAAVDHTVNVSVGATVAIRLQVAEAALQQFRMASFVRLEAKCSSGGTKTGDGATGTYRYEF